jgi:hypothetical protein
MPLGVRQPKRLTNSSRLHGRSRSRLLRVSSEGSDQTPKPKAPPLPTSAAQQTQQASMAIEIAYKTGIKRQQVEKRAQCDSVNSLDWTLKTGRTALAIDWSNRH